MSQTQKQNEVFVKFLLDSMDPETAIRVIAEAITNRDMKILRQEAGIRQLRLDVELLENDA